MEHEGACHADLTSRTCLACFILLLLLSIQMLWNFFLPPSLLPSFPPSLSPFSISLSFWVSPCITG